MAWAVSKRELVEEMNLAATWRVGQLALFLNRYAAPVALAVTIALTLADRVA